jgi:hypothetical protein
VDARKTLSWINREAETKVQGKGLRATLASIAEELASDRGRDARYLALLPRSLLSLNFSFSAKLTG